MTLTPLLGTVARIVARDVRGRFVSALTPQLPSLRLPGIPNYAAPVERLLGKGAKFRDILGRFTTPQGSYVTELNRVDGSQRLPMDLYITDGRKPRAPGARYLYDVQVTGKDRNGREINVQRSIRSSRQLTVDDVLAQAEAQVEFDELGQGGSGPSVTGELSSTLSGAYRK